MHVRGFTRHPNSGVDESIRGTYAGLIEKIPYLQQLGITAVELLPVFQFDAQDCPAGQDELLGLRADLVLRAASGLQLAAGSARAARRVPRHGQGTCIGPGSKSFSTSSSTTPPKATTAARRLLPRHRQPTYYILEGSGAKYANYTGCGNTLNANHPIVRRMIVDSLRYWVEEMHVDGFRFDLASILTRDAAGNPLPNPPVLWDIESEPVLAGTKLIAEAWDAAGLYQVGSFVGDAGGSGTADFATTCADFFRGEPGSVRRVADRIVGSPEIYGHEQREAEQSINFVTCHDGFTLNDLVSYNQQAQRGQRRRQPRRRERQSQLELRRRRPHG